MAYIIPNATETGSGQRFANINQAEPDSVDIEALGNRANWVRSGCVVSIASEQFTVTAGVVVVNNTPYSLAAVTVGIPIARAVVGARTDLVVARLSGSTVSVEVLAGTDSATNPIFPKSKSVVTSFSATYNYDPDNDVLLAAIYVTSAETVTANLVDKRIVNARPTVRSSASEPAHSGADVIGDVVTVTAGISAGLVYVKTGPTTWSAIATRSYADSAGFPIGSVFAWAGQDGQTPGANYLECNGQEVLISSYTTLHSKIGSIYGPAATNYFKLPNLSDNRTIVGTSTVVEYGTAAGTNQTTLTSAHIPEHTHSVSVQKHSALSHTGASVVPGTTAANGGDHKHQTNQHYHTGALVYRDYLSHNTFHVLSATGHGTSGFHVDAINVNEENPSNPYGVAETGDLIEYTNIVRFMEDSDPDTKLGGAHVHALSIPGHGELLHTVSETPYGSSVGSITPVPTLPRHIKMRWYIRAL